MHWEQTRKNTTHRLTLFLLESFFKLKALIKMNLCSFGQRIAINIISKDSNSRNNYMKYMTGKLPVTFSHNGYVKYNSSNGKTAFSMVSVVKNNKK